MQSKQDKINLFKQRRFDKFSPESLKVISDYVKELEEKQEGLYTREDLQHIQDNEFHQYASQLRNNYREKINKLPMRLMITGVSIIIVSQILIQIFL